VMLPEAYIIHQTPMRLRFRVKSRKRDLAWFSHVKERLSSMSGVDSVDVNELSGSILIIHHRKDIRQFLAAAKKQGLFQIARTESRTPVTLRQGLAEGFQTVNRRVKTATGGLADLWDVAFFGLAGFGIYQILRGNIGAPLWYTAFWYAFNIYMKSLPGDTSGG